MSNVHSLLAIYSALDRMVLEDPELGSIIDRYLPGTAGNAGWSEEIRRFLSDPGQPLPEYPNVDDAIRDIVGAEDTSGEEGDSEVNEEQPTASELSRLAYAIGVLSRLRGGTTISDAALIEGLSAIVPEGQDQRQAAADLLVLFRANLRERDDWQAVMLQAQADGLVKPLIARIPLCRTRLKTAHGQLCVVLTTDFTDDTATLNELKGVVDPLNWWRCLSFFCDMKALSKPTRTDGWSRVLEICSTTCGVPKTPVMKTPLKYWKGPQDTQAAQLEPPAAWVNYELDDTPVTKFEGDGRVLVDEGFIKMYSTSGDPATNGVRVVTKKVVCFRELSEIAIAILACVSGYGNQGMDMLLEGIKRRAANKGVGWTEWKASEASTETPTAPGDQNKPADISVPSDPSRPSRRAITLAVEMANDCIDEFAKKSTTVASKMATGTMPIPEMIALNTEFLTRLATDPWRYLDRLRDETRKGSK
jgi:hypothetical protein